MKLNVTIEIELQRLDLSLIILCECTMLNFTYLYSYSTFSSLQSPPNGVSPLPIHVFLLSIFLLENTGCLAPPFTFKSTSEVCSQD